MKKHAVGSFRQKRVRAGEKKCDCDAREGFCGGRGGFVLYLRDVATNRSGLEVLRGLGAASIRGSASET